MTNTIAIIPARGGSKGLPKKNSLLLNKVPLLARPIIDLQKCQLDCKIFVTTDCPELQQIAINNGADCPFLRPSALAKDLTTTEETLKYALSQAEKYYQKDFDYCIFLTATEVYRDPLWIKECLNTLLEKDYLESVFIGYKTTKNYWELDQSGNWKRLKSWMREYSSRQVRNSIIREDTGVCCASRSYLWRQGRRIGDNVEILVKESNLQGLDIHTQFDLDLANFALSL